MRRRDFLKTAGAAAAVLATRRMPAADKDRPNLVIIHTDEHNFRTLGCYRAVLAPKQALVWGPKTVVTTPNIDYLAKHGALCTSFYATTPVCSPSRAALVSGRYPQNTPVVTNNIPLADGIAHESKMGLKGLDATIRTQVRKDAWLLNNNPDIEGVTWHFYRSANTGQIGPNAALAEFLEQNNINWVVHP